ncbi:PIPO, partial [Pepper mottle virus]
KLSRPLTRPMERIKLAGKISLLLVLKKAKDSFAVKYQKQKFARCQRNIQFITETIYGKGFLPHESRSSVHQARN